MDSNLSYIEDLFSNLEMHCPVIGALCENTYTYLGFLSREDHVCSLNDEVELEIDPQNLITAREEQSQVKVEAPKEDFEDAVNQAEEVKGPPSSCKTGIVK